MVLSVSLSSLPAESRVPAGDASVSQAAARHAGRAGLSVRPEDHLRGMFGRHEAGRAGDSAVSLDDERARGIDWSRLASRPTHVPDDLSANLEQLIVDGDLGVGERIPAERDLAASLRVSRASVREALRDLELKGLIDRRPGRGTIVSGDSQRTRQGGSLLGRLSSSERDLLEVMDLRATIEPPIAARAASRATAAGVRGLREIVQAMEVASSAEETVELDERFHREISRASHNPLLIRLLEVTTEWMGPSRKATLQSADRRAASIVAHRRILAAIADHDPEAAEAAMAAHIESVNELLAANLPRSVRPPRAPRASSAAPRAQAPPGRRSRRSG